MKRVLVLCPNVWDREGFAHPKMQGKWNPLFAGEELLESPSFWTAVRFDIFRYATRLTQRARAESVEGVVGTGDYPGCMLAAMVAADLGLPGPRIDDIVRLSHKLYSRELQQKIVPDATPDFRPLSPYGRARKLAYPAFVKPVKGTMSIRARRVESAADLREALRFTLGERVRGHLLMRPFQQLLGRYTDGRVPAHHFIAETPLEGEQVTVDGFVQAGRVTIMGVVDSVMYPGTQNFERFEYPSRLPQAVQERMGGLVRKLMGASGLNDSCFNVELFYDARRDALSVIEINPRMSYQFADLYERVDGTHTYELQLALAVGEPAQWRPGAGNDRAAASFVLRRFSDATVLRTPGPVELRAVAARFPGTSVKLLAHEGKRLSAYDQDVGSYRYAIINMSAPDAGLLHQRFAELKGLLEWKFDVPDEARAKTLATEASDGSANRRAV